MPTLYELMQGFFHLFYPQLCEGCNRQLIEGEFVLCISCASSLPETCYHADPDNESSLRFAGRVPFTRATSFAYFTDDGLLQHLLHGLKYKGKKGIGTFLGTRFFESLAVADWLTGIDIIVPVPLHSSRLRARGYNQAAIIAAAIAHGSNIQVHENVLVRIRNTDSQTRKSRTERAENMADAFSVHNNHTLQGKHILLLDDVLTTGATLEACANALLKVKNVKISFATIGIAIS